MITQQPANLQLDLEAGKVRWLYNDLAGENNFTVVTNAVVATDEWVHIAATYNASTKEAKVFINAKEMGAKSEIESMCPSQFCLLLNVVSAFSHSYATYNNPSKFDQI